ncbi:hypothetical protein LXL04_002677 [Taraxacum kok-saghyz]
MLHSLIKLATEMTKMPLHAPVNESGVKVRNPSLLQLAIDNINPKPSLEVCRHHLHPEIWPLLPVRHQETQQQPSTLDSTAPCFHLGRTTRYHLHSRVVLERRRLSPSLSIVVHSTIFAPAPAFRHSPFRRSPVVFFLVLLSYSPSLAVIFSIEQLPFSLLRLFRRPLLLLLHLGYFFNHCCFSFC